MKGQKDLGWPLAIFCLVLVTGASLVAIGANRSGRTVSTVPPRIDERAMTLLQQNQDVMFGLKSFQAVCKETIAQDEPQPGNPRETYTISRLIADKPDRMRFDSWKLKRPATDSEKLPSSQPRETFDCDGKANYRRHGDSYETESRGFFFTGLEPWQGFYEKDDSRFGILSMELSQKEVLDVTWQGQRTVDGELCDIVHVATTYSDGDQMDEDDSTFAIGARDHIIREETCRMSFGGRSGYIRTSKIDAIKLNQAVNPQAFRFSPPLVVTHKSDESVLADGRKAPDFEAVDFNGQKQRLSSLRGKVVLIDFWASWCGPCTKAMPELEQSVRYLKDAGVPVVVLAVDDSEGRAAFQSWVKANHDKYPSLTFLFSDPSKQVDSKLYKTSGLPTEFVIDRKGGIYSSIVGYGGPIEDVAKAIKAAAK